MHFAKGTVQRDSDEPAQGIEFSRSEDLEFLDEMEKVLECGVEIEMDPQRGDGR